ncbi:MAG: hypothetical protein ACR2NN_09555 [Bryobacteraceae bacterium]
MNTESRVTRRQLAAALASSVALAGQTPAPRLPQNPEEELKAAREQVRQFGDLLGKFAIPMSTEPAFLFKP